MSEREAFEAWAFENGLQSHTDQSLDYPLGNVLWKCWQGRAAVQANVPDGWKLVPVEPTEEMLSNVDEDVGGHCYTCTRWRASYDDCRRVYAAMLSSAPPVPQPAERKPLEDDEQKRNDDLWRLGRSVGK